MYIYLYLSISIWIDRFQHLHFGMKHDIWLNPVKPRPSPPFSGLRGEPVPAPPSAVAAPTSAVPGASLETRYPAYPACRNVGLPLPSRWSKWIKQIKQNQKRSTNFNRHDFRINFRIKTFHVFSGFSMTFHDFPVPWMTRGYGSMDPTASPDHRTNSSSRHL